MKMNKIDTRNINIKALLEVINYLESSERQSYEEHICHEIKDEIIEDCGNQDYILTKEYYNNPNIDHIYAVVMRLKDSLLVTN